VGIECAGFEGFSAPSALGVRRGLWGPPTFVFEAFDGFAGGVGAALDALVDGFEVTDVAVQRLYGGVKGVESLAQVREVGFEAVEAVVDGRRVREVADGGVAVGHRALYRSESLVEVVAGHGTGWPRHPV